MDNDNLIGSFWKKILLSYIERFLTSRTRDLSLDEQAEMADDLFISFSTSPSEVSAVRSLEPLTRNELPAILNNVMAMMKDMQVQISEIKKRKQRA